MKTAPPNVKFKQDTFCSYCGSQFTEQALWPRKCFTCWNESYKNPAPVVVALVPVGNGLLIEERNIEPGKGGWALVSGYINNKETWQQAASRELLEEVGLVSDPDNYNLSDIYLSDNKANILIVGKYAIPYHEKDLVFVPNEEVSEINIIYHPIEMIFPSHTKMVQKFFERI